MKLFNAIAAATLMTTAVALPAAAKHVTGCTNFGCYSIVTGRSYDSVAWQLSNGKNFSGNITCRSGNFKLHDGWVGNLHREGVGVLVNVHCSNRAKLF